MLEGRRLPTVQALAKELGLSQATAFRTIARIRKSGMVKLVDLVRLPDDVCHCIVNLRTHLTNARDLQTLEARLKSDPYVVVAAAVTGKHNYRITLVHRSAAEAQAWFRAITTEAGVIDGALILCRPIIDRHQYAQALSGHQSP